jgi:site-specific DNA recombinase
MTPVEKRIRCAIYTRKSTEEGLEQEFNSLDAQRLSGEAFIQSQAQEGWNCLTNRYDDGGFTGGNMERPALTRLLADIAAGQIDCVVVYKVDRLSRSLLDFARLMEIFDRHSVSFVSVTQQFNSTHSMGRLTLNILLSFAQFEREIISERTRDKIAATRRQGKWTGGHPILGYDLHPGGKLVINKVEAKRVRAIYHWMAQKGRLMFVLHELQRRGWSNKRWITRLGQPCGGKPFTRASLAYLLANVIYRGQVRYKQEVYLGEHQAIVEEDLWQLVQSQFSKKDQPQPRVPSEALLKGKVFCAACQAAMTPSYTTRNASRRYRYYVCTKAQRQGWSGCPSKSLPAGELESYVLERLQHLMSDPELKESPDLSVEKIEDLQTVGPLWARFVSGETLSQAERWLLCDHLLERVDYHGGRGELALTFHHDRLVLLQQGPVVTSQKAGR